MEKLFNGDKLYMLPSVTPLQCMGFVLAGEGDVIAVDSGTQAEADELETLLLSLGGRVDMWFLTHGHFDHIEGLIETLERGKIAVGSIVYRFPPLDYIERVERNARRGSPTSSGRSRRAAFPSSARKRERRSRRGISAFCPCRTAAPWEKR